MSKTEKKGLVPALRFPEFRDTGEWEEKTLDDVAVFFKGKGISKSDIDSQGETPCIRYGELYTVYGEAVSTVFSKTKLPASELFFSQKNDVLIPSSGETKIDIAKASCILLDDVALGSDLNVLRPNENGVFLSYMLNGVCKREIAKKAQGDAVVHLYSSQLKLLEVLVPKEPEQQKIADCLTSIDDLITAQTQKLAALKTHKKGLMKQLFPAEGESVPKLRFPEFRDAEEWNKKEIGKITKVTAGATPSTSVPEYWNGEIPWMNSGELNFKRIYSVASRITKLGLRESSTKIIPPGCVLIGLAGQGKTRGTAAINYIELCTNQSIASIHPNKDEFVSEFLFQKMDTLYIYLRSISKGDGGRGGLNLEIIKSMEILLPALPEQQKIADCLSSIDELIANQAKKIESLKSHKKGLMQQLFPIMNELNA